VLCAQGDRAIHELREQNIKLKQKAEREARRAERLQTELMVRTLLCCVVLVDWRRGVVSVYTSITLIGVVATRSTCRA